MADRMDDYTPRIKDDKTRELMEALADGIEEGLEKAFGEKMGFCLHVFRFNRPGQANHISNANRTDMIEMLRATADRIEANARAGRA